MLKNRLQSERVLQRKRSDQRLEVRFYWLAQVQNASLDPLDKVLPKLEGTAKNSFGLQIQRIDGRGYRDG
jgi:hypothetical protein